MVLLPNANWPDYNPDGVFRNTRMSRLSCAPARRKEDINPPLAALESASSVEKAPLSSFSSCSSGIRNERGKSRGRATVKRCHSRAPVPSSHLFLQRAARSRAPSSCPRLNASVLDPRVRA